jgi:hypothetical protein
MNEIPQWWSSPVQLSIEQRDLFTEQVGKVLVRERIGTDELDRWHDKGWISFSHTKEEQAQWQHVAEIRFVKQIARSGLSDVQIDEMLRDLPRPLRYRSEAIAYSYEYGWVEPDLRSADEIVTDNIDAWLVSKAEAEDWTCLGELAERIGELVPDEQEVDEAMNKLRRQKGEV